MSTWKPPYEDRVNYIAHYWYVLITSGDADDHLGNNLDTGLTFFIKVVRAIRANEAEIGSTNYRKRKQRDKQETD